MPTQNAQEAAAQVWTRPETSHIVMDTVLAEAFANVLDEQREKQGPLLGLATTRELLDEIYARIEINWPGGLNYRTVDSNS